MAVGNIVNKDDFLKLFTTQLQYQDPLKPMDSTEFTAQLAQFSSLEQLFNLNKNMEQSINYQESLNNGTIINLIGKTVKTIEDFSAKVLGINFGEGKANLVLDNGNIITMSDIKEILL